MRTMNRLFRFCPVVLWLILLAVAVIPQPTFAATCTSNGTGGGDWYTGSTWQPGCGTFGPETGDTVIIQSGDTVTLNGDLTGRTLASVTVNTSGVLQTSASRNLNGNTISANGTFRLQQGGFVFNGTFNYGSGGTLEFANTSGQFGLNSDHVFWPAANGPHNVTISGSGGLDMNVARTIAGTLLLSGSGNLKDGGDLTVNGTVQFNGAGRFEVSGPNYGSSSLLKYNTAGTFTRALEWSAASGAGYPNNVQVSNNTTLNLGSGARNMAGNLTIDSGSTVNLGSGDGNHLTVAGSVNIAGTLTLPVGMSDLFVGGDWTRTGTFTPNGSIVDFNGTAAQTINNSTTFARFTVSNTAANVTLAGDQTVTTDINITGRFNLSTFNVNGASPLNVASGATLTLGSADGINSGTGAGNIRTSGTRTFNAGANYIFSGGAAQVTGNGFPATVNNLTIDNANGVTLSAATTVNGTLGLTAGRLTLASNNLTIGPSGSVSGSPSASNMVVTNGTGTLCKRFAGTGSFTYPIGETTGTTEYSPSTLNFTAGKFGGSAQACERVVNAKHPNKLDDAQYPTWISRYWVVTQTGITGFTANASFTYVDADLTIDSGQSEAALYHKIWNGSSWTTGNQTDTATNTFATNVTGFSDHTAFSGSPLSVTMSEIAARQDGNAIRVSWETASELNNRGFNVWRATTAEAPQTQLNGQLIPSLSAGSPGGQLYSYSDAHDLVAGTTYYYWVEAVGTDGSTTFVGPLPVEYRVPTAVAVSGSSTTSAWRASIALLLAGGLTAAMLMAVGRKMAVRP